LDRPFDKPLLSFFKSGGGIAEKGAASAVEEIASPTTSPAPAPCSREPRPTPEPSGDVRVYSASTVLSSPEPPGQGRQEQKEREGHGEREKGHEEHARCAAASTTITTASSTSQSNKPSVRELVKRAEVVGNVFSRSVYGIDKIFITLRQGRKLPLGSYVFVLDDDCLPIVYQVASPEYYRYGYDFEKRLIAYGRTVKDDSYTYDCTGILVGKLYEDGRIEPPRYPVPPLAEVYLCTPELVKMITEPEEEPKVRIGMDPLTKEPVYIKLRPLIRQGLLISGAQGTGKTTALLTLIVRSLEAFNNLAFLILDWTGEFEALINSEYAKRFRMSAVTWDAFVTALKTEDPELLVRLVESEDPRVKGAVHEAIFSASVLCRKEGLPLTKDNLKKKLAGLPHRTDIIQIAMSVIDKSSHIPKEPPKTAWTRQRFIREVEENNVVIVDFTTTSDPQIPDDIDLKLQVATSLANTIWEEATRRKDFGCIVVSDEAHRIAPERAYGGVYAERMDPVWIRLATEGGRNGCPLWFVARRLSLVSKAVTTELQQNFICFNVEDVDRERVRQDLGETFASLLGALPPGEAIMKSAVGFKIPGQVVHVKFDLVLRPSSARYGLEERFKPRPPPSESLGSSNALAKDEVEELEAPFK
jgi:hypothetical protein